MTDVFRSIDWLADHPDAVTVIDVREDWQYEEGHLPGAVNVPFQSFRDPTDDTPGKFPTAATFGRLLGEAGIEPGDRIVACDDEFGVYASRFLVTAEVFGHDVDRLHLLDGDVTAWDREHELTTAVPDRTPREYDAEYGASLPVIGPADLERALDTAATIVDTRDPLEYDTVHVPGAVNFQWRALVDEGARRLLAREECSRILDERGIDLDRPVRLYCNTARRLSFVYAVLRELGHEDLAFYEGGIDAWADYGGPVATT
jgi:thiosulfate/3-mercaptopyruvate sulfurtransferase